MVAVCDGAALARHPLDIRFHDALSTLGARVSLATWVRGWVRCSCFWQ